MSSWSVGYNIWWDSIKHAIKRIENYVNVINETWLIIVFVSFKYYLIDVKSQLGEIVNTFLLRWWWWWCYQFWNTNVNPSAWK